MVVIILSFTRETTPVRPGEELAVNKLYRYLKENILDLPEGELQVTQFLAGHSNLTYELKIGDWQAVLRRPPLGPVAPKAHDMGREYKILKEISPIFSPAPKPIIYCEDKSILGAPFFLMERKHGVLIDSHLPEGIENPKEVGRRLSKIMVENLVKLHGIDFKKTDLLSISKPEGFIERQVHGWIERYYRAKTDDWKEADMVTDWLYKHIPKQQYCTVIHYDYKFNNAMFDEKLEKMVGLFDWEMTTVGDPLADLAVALSYWTEKNDSELLKSLFGEVPVTVLEGFFTREEFIQSYAQLSGRDISNMNFYLVFAYFKLAVIIQQIYFRYKKGQTNDPRFARFDEGVKNLLIHSASLLK